MKIILCKNYYEVSLQAANIVAQQIKNKPQSVLGLPTGSTPLGLYKSLIKMNKENTLDFSGVITFNLDEYYPISRDNAQSYYYFMHDNLFNHININKQNVHILNGEATDPQEECTNYESAIEKAGGIDLQVLGIGQNGHIGFNEPGNTLKSTTNLTDLTPNTIDVNSRFFEKIEDVPKKSLTMGIGSIMKSKKIILLASGVEKANAISELLKGDITTANPSTLLNAHRDVTIIVDNAAMEG
ncbi:MAG: glucosamine-6-phosphate deaminase [Clostridiaceae bacterium]|nr:glucosamine-6-phosphate deaminase [Clostridiaceae bacterium]